MELWLTADDYGLELGVNAAIEELAAAGRLSAVSVMVCEGMALDTLRRLAAGRVFTGLHLTFTQERPLTRDADLAPLLDARGRLPATPWGLAARLRPGRLAGLRREAEAQLARYRALGLPLDFVSSHQHVHLMPPVWWALAGLLRALPGVPLRQAGLLPLRPGRAGLITASSRLCQRVAPLPGCPPLVPVGLGASGHQSVRTMERALAARPWRVARLRSARWELILHPGDERVKGLRSRYGHWGYAWEEERALLATGGAAAVLDRLGLTLAAPAPR